MKHDMTIPSRDDLHVFREKFQTVLEAFIQKRMDGLSVRTVDAKKLAQNVGRYALRDGKRIRPYLAVQTAASCGVPATRTYKLGIALELFHDFALIHDDIMDKSEERRGQATIHRLYELEHAKKSWKGSAAHYGVSSAILGGDLLLTWAEQAMDDVSPDDTTQKRLLAAWNLMKEEVILGQTLDVTMSVLPKGISRKQLLDVLALKSGRYSIGRPILLGYAMAGERVSDSVVMQATEPLGLAFQIQDDILGTFGDPSATGKSTDSDLKEGKITMLAWETKRRIEREEDLAIWDQCFGNPQASPQELDLLRAMMKNTGTYEYVKELSRQLINHSIEHAYDLPKISDWFIRLAKSLDERSQ